MIASPRSLLLLFPLVAGTLFSGCAVVPDHAELREVRVLWVASQSELERECGRPVVGVVRGCKRGGCTLVVFRPRGFSDLQRVQTLGHELLHCFDGDGHS